MPKQTPQLQPKQPVVTVPSTRSGTTEQKKEGAVTLNQPPSPPKKRKTYISNESRAFAYLR